MIVAIDGPAAVGKGTLARRLARRFGLVHLDSGMLYRAVAARARAAGLDPSDPDDAARAARDLDDSDLARPELRDEEVGRLASMVASFGGVRAALLGRQRAFARRPPGGARGAVLDGRDIATVVVPEADVKIFIDASPGARADRRLAELRARGVPSIRTDVERDLKERDRRDRTRDVAPLVAAPDALVLDTTKLDADAVFEAACRHLMANSGEDKGAPGRPPARGGPPPGDAETT